MPKENLEKSFADRIGPIIQRYGGVIPELLQIDPNIFFQANYWTPLKLYCLAAYIHSCYIPIISRNEKIQSRIGNNFYFVDLLSNSGINLVCDHKECSPEPERCAKCKEERKVWMVGSPIIAATAQPPFKSMYFVDMNKTNSNTLQRRLIVLKDRGMCQSEFIMKTGNCNEVVDDIIRDIKCQGNFHFLAFVDNEGLDANWKTIKKILDTHFCDLIINFPTSSVNRNMHNIKTVAEFVGLDDPSELNGQTPLEYYVNKISNEGRTVKTISIDTKKGYHYDLIIVTKKEARFAPAIDSIKKNAEANSAKEAEIAFSILKGKQKRLFA